MQIDRLFREIPDNRAIDVDQALAFAGMGWADAVNWTSLLQSNRILIVAESGAGKTYECRAQQEKLWDAGEPAFFLDLAILAENDVEKMLFPEELERLAAWHTSQSEIATFFLDSLDELKLTLHSFEQALKCLARSIRGQMGRIRVVITTRPTPIDQQLIRRILPTAESIEEEVTGDSFAAIALGRVSKKQRQTDPKIWRKVILLPLTDEQIRAMALQMGVSDPKALLADIVHRQALEFARRPQDLIQICSDWRDHNRVRKHREQVEYDVKVKLRPRDDRREKADISVECAFEGASRLALAALLTRKLTLRQGPDMEGYSNSEAALDPATILSDWPADERQTLLERALFGFASYGRLRFHHRSVIEWLAAARLNTLLEHGMSSRALMRLLLAETPQGKKILRPSLRPVAAWLSLQHEGLFEEIRNREPEVLFNFGDAESLSQSQRSQLLRAFVERYRHGEWRGMTVPWQQIRRFADPQLSPDVKRLWQSVIQNSEIRQLLLKLVDAGRMSDCADIAYSVVVCLNAPNIERIFALDALIAISDTRLKEVGYSIYSDISLWPDEIARIAILRLFPRYFAVEKLCRVLARLPEASSSSGDLSWQLPRVIADANLSTDELHLLRGELTNLIKDGATWSEATHQVRSTKRHLIPGLAKICVLQANMISHTFEWAKSVVTSLRIRHRDYIEDEACKDLKELILELPTDAREIVFWADDAFAEGLRPAADAWQRYIHVAHESVVKLEAVKDEKWVRAALADGNRSEIVRGMMLEIAIQFCHQKDDWHSHLQNLLPLVVNAPDVAEALRLRLQPKPKNTELERLEKESAERRQETLRRDAQAHESWVNFWRQVSTDPNSVFDVGREDRTAWNLWRAMAQIGDESRSSGWNRRFIERYFGSDVADRLRLALGKVWRNDRPTLRSERPTDQKNTYLSRWQFGLAAVTAEAEDKNWVTKLSVDEVRLATRYAPIQLNGFPTWLENLVSVYPAEVDSVLGEELMRELEESVTTDYPSITLQNINYAPPIVSELFVSRLIAHLERVHNIKNHDLPVNVYNLTQTVDVLLKQQNDKVDNTLLTLAAAELQGNSLTAAARLWLSVLLRLDPSAGLNRLTSMLDQDSVHGDLKLEIFASIFGDRSTNSIVDLTSAKFTPLLLLRLVRLAYSYVHPSGDARRQGAYTPDLRDNAEYGRGEILSALLNRKGHDGWSAKLEMANDPLFAHFRDRAIALAEERAAEEADETMLDEASLRSLDRYKEIAPNTRDEMFALMCDRLDDIEDMLLQDSSPRAGWALIRDEIILRQMIAGVFEKNGNYAYRVDQEAATADQKETDIRLISTGSVQQAVIELKIGEKDRSARDLRNGLKEQLVVKYMAPENRRSGCFLITISTDRVWQNPETNERMDFFELIAMLNEEANRIVSEMGGSLYLTVRGLDLRPRLPKEKTTEANRR